MLTELLSNIGALAIVGLIIVLVLYAFLAPFIDKEF